MARPNHPLVEDSFAPLRAETDKLTQAMGALLQRVEQLVGKLAGGAGVGAVRTGRPGSMAPGADGASGGLAKAAKDAEKALTLSERLDKSVSKASASMNGLQRAVSGVGNIAELLGFEDAAKKAEDFAKGLSAVRDIVGGLVAARGVIGSLAASAAVFLVPLGLIQEAIYQATGDMLSLADTISVVALALNKAAEESLAGWKIGFNDLKQFGLEVLTMIGRKFLEVAGKGLQAFSEALTAIAETLRRSGVPGIDGVARSFDAMADAALGASWALRNTYDALGSAAEQGAAQTNAANREILGSTKAMVEGIEQKINELMNKKGASLFRDPKGALTELAAEIKKSIPFGPGESAESSAKKSTSKSSGTSSAAHAAGQQAGVEWTSGVDQALHDAQPALSESVIQALGTDKNGKAINSFKDLIKNVGRLFRENPLQFVFTALGLGSSMGGGLGFARGGQVPWGGGAPSLAHLFAPGLARGGRPSWLPSSDTVAAWLTPGEWVMPVSTVRKYGEGVMEAFRSGLVDPGIAQALAHGVPVPAAVSSPAPRGYASGGAVAGGMGGGAAPVVTPAIVANEATMEALLNGGTAPLLRWMHEHGMAPR